MAQISTGGIHHISLTVSDVDRSKQFYCGSLGFQEVAPLPNGVLVSNGQVLLGLHTAPEQSIPGDRFDPNRVGLDHLSLSVPSRSDLEQAASALGEGGVTCGEIIDLEPFGITVLMARDPDNIQVELSAPMG